MRAAILLILAILSSVGYIVAYRHFDRKALIEFTKMAETHWQSRFEDHQRMANFISASNQGMNFQDKRALNLLTELKSHYEISIRDVDSLEYPRKNGSREYENSVQQLMAVEGHLIDLYAKFYKLKSEGKNTRHTGFKISEVTTAFSTQFGETMEAQNSLLRWNRASK